MNKYIKIALLSCSILSKNFTASLEHLNQLNQQMKPFMTINIKAGRSFSDLLDDAISIRTEHARKSGETDLSQYAIANKNYRELAECESFFDSLKAPTDVIKKYTDGANLYFLLAKGRIFNPNVTCYAQWFMNVFFPQDTLLPLIEKLKPITNREEFVAMFVNEHTNGKTPYQLFASQKVKEITEAHKLLLCELIVCKGSNLVLERYGRPYDGGYVVPTVACDRADVLMGYGIAGDFSFEEDFAKKQNNDGYLFDGGIPSIETANPKLHFYRENLSTDQFLYDRQNSSGVNKTFEQQLKDCGLEDKKIFIKMDIEGAEYAAFEGILKRQSQITGIVLEIHFFHPIHVIQAYRLLWNLNKYFYLVHIHGNNCSPTFFEAPNQQIMPEIMELTFVHKSLIENPEIVESPSFPKEIDMPNSKDRPECVFSLPKSPESFLKPQSVINRMIEASLQGDSK
ncbi:MAG: hypothetical protein HEEMFOPI_00040 [Holosporales bacterium]